MNNSFVKGALLITIATIISKVLGSIFRIPLQNIAGDEVLGIFTIVYPVYMAVLILTVAGIPLAISKLISEARAHGRGEDILFIHKTAGILSIAFGMISFALLIIFSEKIAFFLGGNFALYSIWVVSFTLLFAPFMATYRGFFQGFDMMQPTAVSQVLEQLVRVIIILVLAYLLTKQNQTNEMVAAGVMVGSSVGAIASLIYLNLQFRRNQISIINKEVYNLQQFKKWSHRILKISIPICIGALTMAFLSMVDSFTIPLQLAKTGETEITYLYGIYGRGLALVQIAVVFASALALPLIPHITKAVTKGDSKATRIIVEKAITFNHLTAWPAAIGLVVLTLPVNLALFMDLEGNVVIAVLTFSSLFTAFAVLTTAILQGINKANVAAYIVLLCGFVKIGLNILLVNLYGLTGAAVATLVTYMLLALLNILSIYRTIPFQLFQKKSFIFVICSMIMGVIIGGPIFFIQIDQWLRIHALSYLCVMLTVGFIVYLLLIISLKGISKSEIKSYFLSK